MSSYHCKQPDCGGTFNSITKLRKHQWSAHAANYSNSGNRTGTGGPGKGRKLGVRAKALIRKAKKAERKATEEAAHEASRAAREAFDTASVETTAGLEAGILKVPALEPEIKNTADRLRDVMADLQKQRAMCQAQIKILRDYELKDEMYAKEIEAIETALNSPPFRKEEKQSSTAHNSAS